jgi:hypothetical protein
MVSYLADSKIAAIGRSRLAPRELINSLSDEVFDDRRRHYRWIRNFCYPKVL